MLAQAVTGTPGHVNAMAASVGFFLERFPIGEMNPGDVFVTNDPWYGTGHLNDFTVVTPVFRADRPVALFAATSHIADVGGLGFGPDGRQVFEEGLNIPMSRLFRGGETNETLLEIMARLRDPQTGCPWDIEQDFASIAPYTIEEAYEVADAILLIGRVCRSTGHVRVGLGASRQDVNVSVRGGRRVEIKGVPKASWAHARAIRALSTGSVSLLTTSAPAAALFCTGASNQMSSGGKPISSVRIR